MTPAVRFDRVSIVFGRDPKRALPMMDAGEERADIQRETGQVLGTHDCTLDVAEGEILVLMGLSGSGKSTLLRAVNGLNPITRGDVIVNCEGQETSVATARARVLRKLRSDTVSMVFQQFALLPWRSVRDNVGLGLELSGMSRRARREKVDRALDNVGLGDWAERQVGELSGGMQQRVGLARAFVTDAPILLMDEPFSALDPLIRGRLQDELLELQQTLKRTIIFVSHDLDEAFKIGDRIAIMEGGRIKQAGTPQDIFTNPANDYVAAFVRNMNPLAALRLGDIAVPGEPGDAPRLGADATIDEAMRTLIAGPHAVCVTDKAGIPVGVVTPEVVLRRLVDPGGKEDGIA